MGDIISMADRGGLPNEGRRQKASAGRVTEESEGRRIVEQHRRRLQVRRYRDATSEKYAMHVDGEGGAQWLDLPPVETLPDTPQTPEAVQGKIAGPETQAAPQETEAVEEQEVEQAAQAALDPAGAPFDPATEPSLVKISEDIAGAELELRHLRIKAQGQTTDGGPTATEQIPDAEKEISRLEQEYEAEAQRVREAKEGDVDLLAPQQEQAQVQLVSDPSGMNAEPNIFAREQPVTDTSPDWQDTGLTPSGAPSASEGPQGDIFQEQQSMFGLVPQESDGMPAARSPEGDSGAPRMTPAMSMPPSTQPLSGPRQVSAQASTPSSTTRPMTPPSREGGVTTFDSATSKTSEGWDIVQQSDDVEELKRRAADLVQPYREVIRQVQRDVPGAKLVGARSKSDERLFEKMGQRGNDPSIIGDYLGGRMSVDTPRGCGEGHRRDRTSSLVGELEGLIAHSGMSFATTQWVKMG